MLPEELMENELQEELTREQTIPSTEDYGKILKQYDLEYAIADHYLQVGEITKVQGWILHISVIMSQATELVQKLVPVLVSEGIPFKIPLNKKTAELLSAGMLGHISLGKTICIYPDSDEKALTLAQKLIESTAGFKGPDIPTDIHLDAVIYTRYGSFKPILQSSADGAIRKYIYNLQGQLVEDKYNAPFQLPEGISWPFTAIKSYSAPPVKKILNGYIKPIAIVKYDPKGNVIKGLYIKKWFRTRYCLVKEGKKNMYSDEYGRDIQERLEWQYQLHTELAGHIPIPKIVDYFRENKRLHLAMEFIDGIALDNAIVDIYNGNSWIGLPLSSRIKLLDHLLGAISIIKKMHEMGYVHRDITSGNFMVDKKNKLYIIDLEVTYSIKLHTPNPPFGAGTPGFMAPEQFKKEIPTEKEDVYSIGTLMIMFFTCLPPIKFELNNLEQLSDDLYFFIPERNIVNLIVSCLQPEASQRPDMTVVYDAIYAFRSQLLSSADHQTLPPKMNVTEEALQQVIHKALNGLCSEMMTTENDLWISKTLEATALQMSCSIYPGFYKGISGVLFMLARLHRTDIEIGPGVKTSYQLNFEYIRQNYLSTVEKMTTGFYSGSAGLGVMMAAGMESGLLEATERNISFIRLCLDREPGGLDLLNGAAGQGIALLQCMPYLPHDFAHAKLQTLTNFLLAHQQKDGSWGFAQENGKKIYVTGLTQGMAGMVCFLLMAGAELKNKTITNVAVKALGWYEKHAIKKGTAYIWTMDSETRDVNPWVLHGTAGIALMFIKAYELLGNPVYKSITEGILSSHVPYLSCKNLSHAWGLSGLGEVYLEAWRIFKDESWRERADWIASAIIHQQKQHSDNACYWLSEDGDIFPTADLITDNSGIIYFLARRLAPDRLPYHLFNPGSLSY